jgi:Zn-dependent protease with chaperone function
MKSNKKGQAVIMALFIVAVLIAVSIPVIALYNGVIKDLIGSIDNIFIRIILLFLPFMIIVGIIYVFVNRLRAGATQ